MHIIPKMKFEVCQKNEKKQKENDIFSLEIGIQSCRTHVIIVKVDKYSKSV